MMMFDKTVRPAAKVLVIAALAGLLPLGGCSESATSSTSRSGDKRDDPALKASMQKSTEERFKSATPVKKVDPGLGPGKLR
jgi:hypothetical protein